jgi:hypothetical protein
MRVATRHAIEDHGHADTPELREQVRHMLVDEPSGSAYTHTP